MAVVAPPRALRHLAAEFWRRTQPDAAAARQDHHSTPGWNADDFAEHLAELELARRTPKSDDVLDQLHDRGGGHLLSLRQVLDAGRAAGFWAGRDDEEFRALAHTLLDARERRRGERRGLAAMRMSRRPGAVSLDRVRARRSAVDWAPDIPVSTTEIEPVELWLGVEDPLPSGLGVSQFDATGAPGGSTDSAVGTYAEVMADIAAMGGGIVRRFQECDLTWYALMPTISGFEDGALLGDTVPMPLDILSSLAPDSDAWARFDAIVATSILTGVRLSPTLFDDGGGGPLSQGGSSDKALPGTTVTFADMDPAKPAWIAIVRAASSSGWDDFYWNDSREDWPAACTAAITFAKTPELIDSAREFARYAIDAYFDDADSANYLAESARRKALALAAFGEAVARKIERWVQILTQLRIRPTDVFADFEVSNENDYFYATTDSGKRAYATHHAYLVGPLLNLGIPIRASELSSWAPTDDPSIDVWDRTCKWWLGALQSIPDVTAFLSSSLLTRVAYAGYLRHQPDSTVWPVPDIFRMNTIIQAGFAWPHATSVLDGTAYVQQVGYHIFHCWNTSVGDEHPATWLGSADIAADAATFVTEVVDAATALGFTLSWTSSAIGFMAEIPDHPSGNTYDSASPLLQAAMLVRYFLLLRTAGASSLSWFTYMSPVQDFAGPDSGGEYNAMGLRQDVVRARGAPYGNGAWYAATEADFNFALDAYRRPSWHAFQRLATLLDYVSAFELLYSDSGGVVLRLTLSGLEPAVVFDGFATPGYFRYAYVCWLDQDAEAASFRYEVSRVVGLYAELPLVPTVTYDESTRGEAVTWDELGWVTAAGDPLVLQILRSGSETGVLVGQPRPYCLLVNQSVEPVADVDTTIILPPEGL